MPTINRFEDLEIWRLSRILAKKIYLLTLKDKFSKEFRFKEQIKASAGSIMDNIAEGFERDGNKEFINFLSITKGSGGEIKSQLYRAFDWELISDGEWKECYDEYDVLTKKVESLMKYLTGSGLKGKKFR